MASLAASTAAASLGVSEMLGNPLNFSGAARSSAPTASSPATFKTVALFSKKKASPPKSKPVAVSLLDEELAKWYGPDRRIFLPDGLLDRSEIPEYLTGEVPGDYGYDPFGLSKKPEDFAKYQAFELIHARWAMLGAAGFIIPEAFNKFGANCGPEAVWFKTGALLLDGNTLNYFGKNIPINLVLAVVAEVVLLGGAEYYRITNGLDFEDKLHPGGPFDPLGLAKDPDQAAILKVKEIKNGRLAMFARRQANVRTKMAAVSSTTAALYISRKDFSTQTPMINGAISTNSITFATKLRKFHIRSSGELSADTSATEADSSENPIEASKEPPSLISALNVERALRGIPITDVDHYGRLGLQRGCSSEQVTVAYQRKVEEMRNQGLNEEELDNRLELLKESYIILSSEEERRMYDWSLARSQDVERYVWPFEVDKTKPPKESPPMLQEPEDVGPTRLVGYFILGWLILSFIVSIALNQ